MECIICRSEKDVVVMELPKYGKITVCMECQTKPREVGRPSLGITKKISLTLPAKEWEWVEEEAKGNRSQFLRHLVWEAQSLESKWDNYACLGYAILGAKKIGLSDEKIDEMIKVIYEEFDLKSVPEANEVYCKSDY